MTATVPVPVVDIRSEDLCGKKIYNRNFAGLNLSRLNLSNSLFYGCNFNSANMSETNCSESEFFRSSFRDTICYRTNFMNAKLAETVFGPKDCTGMVISLSCSTFENMRVSQIWVLGMITLLTMTKPEQGPVEEDLRQKLIDVVGRDRYMKLRALFSKRGH
jgi:hypothetical protein